MITHSLDAVDEQAFWDAVHEAHGSMDNNERAAYVSDATLADDLADADDDALSTEDA